MENWIVVTGIFIEPTVRGKVTIFGEFHIRKIDFCTENERWKQNEKFNSHKIVDVSYKIQNS